MTDILAMVLAGGEGSRLQPLTSERSKPSVPFAGRYRIVDFVLSNLVNSGIHSIYLLVQYKSQSLIEHINKGWVLSHIPGHFITVVPPQMREGPEWFSGTADAISQNINLIERAQPNLVAIFGADHVYRMDVRQMVDFHRQRGAAVSVAAIPIPLKESVGVRHHRRGRRGPHPRLSGEAGAPAGHARRCDAGLRLDGQLPVRDRGAAERLA